MTAENERLETGLAIARKELESTRKHYQQQNVLDLPQVVALREHNDDLQAQLKNFKTKFNHALVLLRRSDARVQLLQMRCHEQDLSKSKPTDLNITSTPCSEQHKEEPSVPEDHEAPSLGVDRKSPSVRKKQELEEGDEINVLEKQQQTSSINEDVKVA